MLYLDLTHTLIYFVLQDTSLNIENLHLPSKGNCDAELVLQVVIDYTA